MRGNMGQKHGTEEAVNLAKKSLSLLPGIRGIFMFSYHLGNFLSPLFYQISLTDSLPPSIFSIQAFYSLWPTLASV